MGNISQRIIDILSDKETVINENQNLGGLTGFGASISDQKMGYRHKDAERKAKERAREKRIKNVQGKKTTKKDEEVEIDPRLYMQNSELRFSLKEAFINHLIEYLESNNKKHILEAVSLLKEYPNLKEWVKQESHKSLPKNPFSLYALSEWLDEEVGAEHKRPQNKGYVWHLTESGLEYNKPNYQDAMVMECQISPDKALIYVPAFTKYMEELIFSGKIDEPVGNPLRKAKQLQEIITDDSVNSGMITKIHKGE